MNELSPTFSIITVTYNAEATIEVTLRSVQQQTYRQIEHIIVDGGLERPYLIYNRGIQRRLPKGD